MLIHICIHIYIYIHTYIHIDRVAPPVEDSRHERDADDGEHQEDEQTQPRRFATCR